MTDRDISGGGAQRSPQAGILTTFREAPAPVKALLAGTAVNKLGSFMQVFIVLFLVKRGFSDVSSGFALGCYGAGSIGGVLAGGWFSDRNGARRTIVVGMVGTAAMVLAVLYVASYPALLAVIAMAGAASQLYRPAAASMLAELTPEDRQVMIFAMSRLALNVGTTAAPLIGAVLLSVSYALLFWGEALVAVCYAAIAAFALPDGRDDREAVRSPEADAAESAGSAAGGYRAVLADRRYLLYLCAVVVNAAVYIQYLSALPLAMKGVGLATFWYGAMVSLNGAIVITCELQVTKLVRRWDVHKVLAVGFTLLGAGFACYALPGGLAVFFVGTLLWTLAEIVEGPTMFAYPVKAGPGPLSGRYVGAMEAAFGIGSAIGPVAGVALLAALGKPFWLLCGAASLIALVPGWRGTRLRVQAPLAIS